MRRRNLNEKALVDVQRRVRDMEGGAPTGFSSITRGQLRVASAEGLLVEGSIRGVANNELGIPAHMQWDGTAVFSGFVKASRFSVENGQMRTAFDKDGVVIQNGEFKTAFTEMGLETSGTGVTGLVGGPEQRFTYSMMLGYAGLKGETSLGSKFSIGPGDLRVKGLPTTPSFAGKRVLVIDEATGIVFAGPTTSTGIGGDPNVGAKPYDGTWPVSPYSFDAFHFNNLDGESDYGVRNTGKGWHDGIDYSGYDATDSSPVRAIGPGIVIDPSGYVAPGDWAGVAPVIIKHDPITKGSLAGKQIFSVYAHMWTSTVSVGQRVKAGQQVGTLGNSGQSLGSHLHLEIHINSLHMYGNPGVSGSQDPVPILNEYGGWPK